MLFSTFSRPSHTETGTLSNIRFGKAGYLTAPVYHALDRSTTKQRLVSWSFEVEIVSWTVSEDCSSHIKYTLASIFCKAFIHELVVDCEELNDTVTTLHEEQNYLLRQTVQQIHDSFESQKLNVPRLVQGVIRMADGLTKGNTKMHFLLNNVLSNGVLDLPPACTFFLVPLVGNKSTSRLLIDWGACYTLATTWLSILCTLQFIPLHSNAGNNNIFTFQHLAEAPHAHPLSSQL